MPAPFTTGSNRARFSMSAAMPNEWRKTSIAPCTKSSLKPGAKLLHRPPSTWSTSKPRNVINATSTDMNAPSPPLDSMPGQPLNAEQRSYLEGLFCGLKERGLSFGDVEPNPVRPPEKTTSPNPLPVAENLVLEERIKKELHPLDAYPLLLENAAAESAPDRENIFRFKWHGLFYLAPHNEAFMARLRIPAGQVKTFQLRELAHVAKDLTSGYVQITTRANFQLRLIKPKDAPEFLRRIQSVGLHTRGAGADNIRNLTANPTAGIDPHELIDVLPLCQELAQIIINDRSFYDLP